jgi:hypothetical protein
MTIKQVISENKHTHKVIDQKRDMMLRQRFGDKSMFYRSKVGYCEAIVEEGGKLVTRHLIKA